MPRLWTRAIRPSDEIPNDNDPVTAAPGTVGPPNVHPGDPHGIVLPPYDPAGPPPPRIVPSAWSGWPAEWLTPNWYGRMGELTDTAWMCVDLNANILSTMPPYLVDAAATLSADWMRNPEPGIYTSWEEFAKQLVWDYQLGEAFLIATAHYSTGFPARFHVVPPWTVNIEMDNGFRRYSIGSVDVTPDILHIRYTSSVGDAHGHGPLEVGRYRLVAASMLMRYASTLVTSGLIPSSILETPADSDLSPEQAAGIRDDWVAQRIANPGMPAVLSGGLKWTPTQLNAEELSLLDLSKFNESRIAYLLGVPANLVGLPSGGDPMTYNTQVQLLDFHWRAYLRPKAQTVMAALSEWLLPRGTRIEVNRDAYVQPEPLQRAQTQQILNAIKDDTGRPVLSVDEIRARERLDNSSPDNLAAGVLR